MESASLKASERDRRNSWRASRRISNVAAGDADNMDVGADALVSDGFSPLPRRTSGSVNRGNNVSHFSTTTVGSSDHISASTDHPSLPPQTSHFSVTTAGETTLSSPSAISPMSPQIPRRTSRRTRPSSIAKPPLTTDHLALRHDGSTSEGSETARESTPSAPREALPIAAATPYDGPSNPSHPYQLYPQNVRDSRPMSLAPSPSTPSVQDQRIVEQQSRPGVGFGAADQYRRRLGPDGEEVAGIIGPDGHTEELPPYSRYPEEHYARKVRDATDAPVPPTGRATSSTTFSPGNIPGAGGIGLATRNPEFEGDDPESPRSRHSSRTFASNASHHEINVAAATVSEKGKPLKKWQIVARRRMCGVVPYWALCLLIIVLVVMIICVGAVVGTVMARHNNSNNQHHGPIP
jgi:hypothetical protein